MQLYKKLWQHVTIKLLAERWVLFICHNHSRTVLGRSCGWDFDCFRIWIWFTFGKKLLGQFWAIPCGMWAKLKAKIQPDSAQYQFALWVVTYFWTMPWTSCVCTLKVKWNAAITNSVNLSLMLPTIASSTAQYYGKTEYIKCMMNIKYD